MMDVLVIHRMIVQVVVVVHQAECHGMQVLPAVLQVGDNVEPATTALSVIMMRVL
jgi:hypothetical protein